MGEAQRVGDPVDCVEDERDADGLGQGDVGTRPTAGHGRPQMIAEIGLGGGGSGK
jgi:hypothetical protein